MLNPTVKKVLITAVKIRVSKGEKLEEIINSYVKLDDLEKYELLAAVKEG